MRCSHSDWNVSTQQKLVFFTDETNPAYLEALTSGLAALPRWGGGVIHGDPEVVKHLEEEDKTDNYLVYAASPHVPTPSPWQACRRVRGPRRLRPSTLTPIAPHLSASGGVPNGGSRAFPASSGTFSTQVASLLMSDAEELYSMERCHNRAPCGRTDAGPALRFSPPKPQRTEQGSPARTVSGRSF